MSKSVSDIAQLLSTKAQLKQELFQKGKEWIKNWHEVGHHLVKELQKQQTGNVPISYKKQSDYTFQLEIAGDTLMVDMHTNVFKFDPGHRVWKGAYLKKDEKRGYCMVFSIYNFLSDSFRFQRLSDIGELVGRVFVNHEGDFFTEGVRDFSMVQPIFCEGSKWNNDLMKQLLCEALHHSIHYDLFVPQKNNVERLQVNQVLNQVALEKRMTGKRLGFNYKASFGEEK